MSRQTPRRARIRGRLDRIRFESKILRNSRDVVVYLPPGYDARDDRVPVLYMQDGQNLFEPDRAFIRGQHWRLNDAADGAIAARTMQPVIIAGIDHIGDGRIDEYTPVRDPKKNAGGGADRYGRMLVEELKPLIDSRYRTAPVTGIGGSSLGGLLSLYLALKHPAVFGRAAVMSPSVWWAGRAILKEVDQFRARRRPRIWLDAGGREGSEAISGARALRDRLVDNGWTGENLVFHEEKRGDHSERAWAGRVRKVLEFLFPPT